MAFPKGSNFFNWKKIIVRSSHLILTLYITVSLLIKETEIRSALVNKDYLYIFGYSLTVYSSIFFYFITCLKDPGYVTQLDSLASVEQATNAKILRKCETCEFLQPLRSHHCQVCKRCVKKFDHHCPWLETCIGQNNHRYFYLFLISTNALIIWSAVIACKAIVHIDSWLNWFAHNALFLFDLHVLTISFLVCFSLFCVHTYLMFTNSTTWEKAARKKITYLMAFGDDINFNPFHEGYCKNMFKFMFYCGKDIKWEVQYKKFLNIFSTTFIYSSKNEQLKETIVK